MKNKTKWIPIISYEYSGKSHVIFCRLNKKTGMMYFKDKKIHSKFTNCYIYPVFNTEEQIKKLLVNIT